MHDVLTRMAHAAQRLMEALDDGQRARARFPFEPGGERELWFYTPTDHGGLPLNAMTPVQQQLAHRLVASGLSLGGYATVATIMGLDNVLDSAEGFRSPSPSGVRFRDPGAYYVSIFGEPGGSEPWSWRFGGHHVSLHYLVNGGRLSALPSFLGANPAEHPGVGANVLRPLAAEEDLGRELLHLLSPGQRSRAVISPVPPPDLVTSNRPVIAEGDRPLPFGQLVRLPGAPETVHRLNDLTRRIVKELSISDDHLVALEYTEQPKGLPASEMTEGQRDAFVALLHQYIDRMPDEVAELEMARLRSMDLGALCFAWAGGDQRRQPHYYRVQGVQLLVEYDNTQDGTNHIHTVWRDPVRDFGRDLLAEHYAHAHR